MPKDIYEVRGDRDLASIHYRDRADINPVEAAIKDGAPLPDARPIPLQSGDYLTGKAVHTHCLGFGGGGLLLADEAIETLGPLLSGAGYFIDTELELEMHYRIFVCQRVLDALDEQKSELERFKSTGRISDVLRHAFHEERLEGADIFKLKGLRARLFVTDRFVSRVNDHGLLGFRFLHVWNRTTRGVRFDPDQSAYEAFPGEAEHRAEAKRRAAREALARYRAAKPAAEQP